MAKKPGDKLLSLLSNNPTDPRGQAVRPFANRFNPFASMFSGAGGDAGGFDIVRLLAKLQRPTDKGSLHGGTNFPSIGTRGAFPGQSIMNPDGTGSSERTITVGFDDGTYLLPTIVVDDEGFLVKVSNEAAIRLFKMGRNPAVGKFGSAAEANRYAGQRSDSGGRSQSIAKF